MITIDEALHLSGDDGKYQFKLFLISSLITFVLSAQIMSPTYSFIRPTIYCDDQICEDNQETCSKNNYIIDPNFKYTNIVTEFDLYCDNKKFATIIPTINFFGSMIGGGFLSQLADKYGRYQTLLISLFLTNVGLIGIYFSYNIYALLISTFIMGMFEIGVYIIIPVLINETCGFQIKQIYSTGTLIFWCLAEIIISIAFFLIPNWRTIELYFIVLPGIISLIITAFVMKESPRFYYQQHNYKKALNILQHIAKVNGNDINNYQLVEYINQKQDNKHNILDLFRNHNYCNSSIGFILISYATHLLYYGGQFLLEDITVGNMIYLTGIFIGVSEMLGYFAITFIISKVQRKLFQTITLTIQILGCFSFLFYGITKYQVSCNHCFEEIIMILLCCIIRFFNSISFALMRQQSTELYPTQLRATGSGLLFTLGIFGSFSSSYMIALANILKINQIAFLGLCSTTGILGSSLTKETLNKTLVDNIEEDQTQNEQLIVNK